MERSPRVSEAWQHLAQLLVQRRVELDHRFRNRRAFCDEKKIEYRVISDIEGARRDNFGGPMITAIEVAYEIAEGSIRLALDNPHIEKLPEKTGDAPQAVIVPDGVRLVDLAPWEQHIWLTPGLSVQEREMAIYLIRVARRDLAPEAVGGLFDALSMIMKRQEQGQSRQAG